MFSWQFSIFERPRISPYFISPLCLQELLGKSFLANLHAKHHSFQCQNLPNSAFQRKKKLAKEEIYFVNLDISAIKSSKITKARKKIAGGGVRYRYFREGKNL